MNLQANNITSYQLSVESLQCNFSISQFDPTHIKIVWDIPTDHNNKFSDLCYHGVVIVASPIPLTLLLVDGTQYTSDPTTNVTNHLGDKVDGGLVVFDCYDITTNSCLIESPLDMHFYAFIQDRHHMYTPFSINLSCDNVTPALISARKSTQTYEIANHTITDVVEYATSPVGLTETLEINVGYPPQTISFTYNTTGITYETLINQFNTFSKQQSADYIGNVAFNTGTLWLTNNTLFEWSGFALIPKLLYIQNTQPHVIVDGIIWKNGTAFKTRNNPNWDNITVLSKPTLETTTSDFWFNGTTMHIWEGEIWRELPTLAQLNQPGLPLYDVLDGHYWLNDTDMTLYHIEGMKLVKKTAITSSIDPLLLPTNYYWVNNKDKTLNRYNGSSWDPLLVTFGTTCSQSSATTQYYFNTETNQLFDLLLDVEITTFIQWNSDPLLLPQYTLWFKDDTEELFIRNGAFWVQRDLIIQPNNPLIEDEVEYDTVWNNNNEFRIYNGNWDLISPIINATDPTIIADLEYVFDISTQKLYQKQLGLFIEQPYLTNITDPAVAEIGEFWLNGSTLSMWNGLSYVPVLYSLTNPTPTVGFKWYDTLNSKLFLWNGSSYIETEPDYEIIWDYGLTIQQNLVGSQSIIAWKTVLPIKGIIRDAIAGSDEVSSERMQHQIDVGGHENDISDRIDIIEYVKRTLGAPTNVVELTDAQLNDCVDSALRTLRTYSSVSTNKQVMLMEIKPNQSSYILSNKRLNYHKITDVLQIHRLPSAFLTAVGSQQIYGQLVLQQLYRAGSFDLLSYHMVASYIEQMEHMFASKIQFGWIERTRTLTLYNVTGRAEIVLVECAVERTENDLFTDRHTEDWIRRWSTAEARERLADIRGKFATLPGAGGGISLNASDLTQKAADEKQRCLDELRNYIVDTPEQWGGRGTFIMG